MSKIHLISDVHLEFHRDYGRSFYESLPGGDILVVAGDTAPLPLAVPALLVMGGLYNHVVAVCGNHEWYGQNVEDTAKTVKELEETNVHLLHRDRVTINGIEFAGCPLWYPYTKGNERFKWSDFHAIKCKEEGGATAWIYSEAAKDAAFVAEASKTADVMITHMIPDARGVHPHWAGNECNQFFLAQQPEEVLDGNAAYWCFGHTHNEIRPFQLGKKTVALANPHGYPHTVRWNYGPAVLEI